MADLLLASASPRRLELLRQIGIEPTRIVPAGIDETPRRNELPEAYASRIAREKCDAVASLHPGVTVLAADTVVAAGRRILPKAEDEATAEACLQLLSGRRHRVHTAVCVRHPGQRRRERTVTTLVRFKRLSQAELEAYLASAEWVGKAGGYAIQGRAGAFIPWISGSYSNVVGLPLAETASLIQHGQPVNALLVRPPAY